MNDISKYNLNNILEDIRRFDTTPNYQYIESIVTVMKWHYKIKKFDSDIIFKSQQKNMAVMDYIIDSYKSYLA